MKISNKFIILLLCCMLICQVTTFETANDNGISTHDHHEVIDKH